MNYQYGSFKIQSAAMLNVLADLNLHADKKVFIITGDVGSGKTTMMNHIQKLFFTGQNISLFDGKEPVVSSTPVIVTTTKELAFEMTRKFDRKFTCVVEMPNLYERKADIVNFAGFFIEVLGLMNNSKPYKLTDKAVEKLLQYNWPGNFHELETVLERAFENSQSEDQRALIEPEHIELNLQMKEIEFSIGQKLDEVERKYILQTLYFVHQNRTRAAEILGISIRTLRNKINQYREEGYL